MADPGKNRPDGDVRILILEDNAADAELMENLLREAGFAFKSKLAGDRPSFVRAIHEFCPDIILSDYDLPAFSGAEALQLRKELCPETPFILVTGAVGEERAIEILTGGATDYVLKKNLSRLLPAVRRALHENDEHRRRKEAEAERDGLLKELEIQVRKRTEALQLEIVERKRAEEVMNRQVEFDGIISGILARFAICTAEEIDREIRAGLEKIGRFHRLENVFIILTSAESRTWSSVYSWDAPGAPSVGKKYQNVPIGTNPWNERALLKVEAIQINSLDDLPPEAVAERREWEREGLRSQLQVPLRGRGKRVIGSVGFRSYSRQIQWSPQDIRTLRLFSDAVANVLERKKAEGELKDRTRQLEKTNRDLESFSYSVSHDLRAPLRAIDGFSWMILEGEQDLSGETKDRIRKIRENALKMDRLINDLLDLSRSGRAPLSRNMIDMDRLVTEVWKEQLSANPDRRMELRKGSLPEACGDEALIRQVLTNLVANAVKFTRKRDPAVIETGCDIREKEVIFSIRDNGAGFDMRYYDKLFGAFQRLHPESEYEGTGVGLAIVQRIIQRHGGKVWAEGSVGKGATFYFSLPRPSSSLP